jgi:hypothetical protein
MSTATSDLDVAYSSVQSIAAKASAILRGLRGRTLSLKTVAEHIGIPAVTLDPTRFYLTYLALEAALLAEGWVETASPDKLKRYRASLRKARA